jgi:hypothetical protein
VAIVSASDAGVVEDRGMSGGARTGKIAVRRTALATRDMDVMADLINRQYVEHKAWFRCPAPARIDAGIRTAVGGPARGLDRPVPRL